VRRAALLIEDGETSLVVRTSLECAGFECRTFTDMVALLRAVRRDRHALIVADTTSTSVDCAALLGWRTSWLGSDVRMIALGPDDPRCIARTLDLGVDDYVTRPVRSPELLARVSASLRRSEVSHATAPAGPSVGSCSVDRTASAIVSPVASVALTTRELALALMLFESAGQVVTRHRIAREVWGQDPELSARSIEQHIYQLRRKLKRCARDSIVLRGVYGSGYRIDAVDVMQGAGTPKDARNGGPLNGPWPRAA